MRYVSSCLYRGTSFSDSVLAGICIASNANRTKEVGESIQKETKEEKTVEAAGVVGVRGTRKCECECVRACVHVWRAEGKRTTGKASAGHGAERREKERKTSVR